MKDYESIMKELNIAFFRDYAISIAVNNLEERIKKIEKGSEIIYKATHREGGALSPEEEYKRTPFLQISESDWELRKWEEELGFFNDIKKNLLEDKTYRNKFAAIKDKKIIDYDLDKFRLAKRINGKYPDEVVLIAKVQAGFPVAELPSPEIIR